MNARMIEDRIGGVRVVRRAVRGACKKIDQEQIEQEQIDQDLEEREDDPEKRLALVEPGIQRRSGIVDKGPDGSFLVGNRGVPVVVPASTVLTTAFAPPIYPLLQVRWSDNQSRPGLVSLGLQFPQLAAGATPPSWPSLVAHLEWTQGSSSRFTADVDVKLGTAFPLTFSSLVCSIQKDYQLAAPTNDSEVTAYAGVASSAYGGFGSPTRTLQVILAGSGVSYSGQINCPAFNRRVNITWDQPQTSTLLVTFLLGGYGAATVLTRVFGPTGGPLPTIVVPNNCYGLLFASDYAARINATFDIDVR